MRNHSRGLASWRLSDSPKSYKEKNRKKGQAKLLLIKRGPGGIKGLGINVLFFTEVTINERRKLFFEDFCATVGLMSTEIISLTLEASRSYAHANEGCIYIPMVKS